MDAVVAPNDKRAAVVALKESGFGRLDESVFLVAFVGYRQAVD